MPYIAKKSVKFDRSYSIGEHIPDAVVDPGRASSLIAMGRIVYIEPENEPENGTAQAPQDGADSAGGVNAPEEGKNAAGEPVEAAEQQKKGKAKK